MGPAVLLGRWSSKLMRAVAISVFLACVGMPASATILQQLTFEEMAQKSTLIVRAKVTSSGGVVRGGEVFTIYRFETLETLKSSRPASELAVAGGIAGGIRQVVAGSPILHPGPEYVFFLWTGPSGLAQLLGMSQGLFTVERNKPGDARASRMAAGEQMLDSSGRAVRDEALSMPWAELKAKVSQALSAVPKTAPRTLAAGAGK
jgi:hypothetical protein